MYDAGRTVHPVVFQTSANTTAVASDDDEDDGSKCDVIATRPGHLLLTDIGSCSASKFVFYAVFDSIVIIVIMVYCIHRTTDMVEKCAVVLICIPTLLTNRNPSTHPLPF